MHTFYTNFLSYQKRFFWIIIMLIFASASVSAQNINKKRTNYGVGYLEYLPSGYSSGSNFPVIIYLHGKGEKGNGSDAALNLVKKWGPLHEIDAFGSNMCFTVNGTKECFVVIAPQTSSGFSGDFIEKIIDHTINNYKVDPNRVYLTGLSMGAIGTWGFSYGGNNKPNKIAAIAPIAGAGNTSNACYLADNNIGVWAFHGLKDGIISPNKSKDMVNALNKCKTGYSAKLTLYEGCDHSKKTWEKAYNSQHTYQSPNMYEWFLKNKKGKSSGSTDSPTPTANQNPIANAGADKTITLPTNLVTLSGVNSKDNDGDIVKYVWSKVSGPAATIKSSTSKITDVANLVEGTYVFRLKVTDNKGAVGTDDIKIIVQKSGGTSGTLVANAGNDATIYTHNFTLDGTKSSAGTGKIVRYEWKKISGNINFGAIQTGATYNVTDMRPGDYVFQLTVVNDKGAKASDKVSVKVIITDATPDTQNNKAPVAKAGSDITIYLPNRSITLNGGQSTDSDGSIKNYVWEKLAGNINFGGLKQGAVQKVTDMRPGNYEFELTVTDNDGAQSTDRIIVRVKDGTSARTATASNIIKGETEAAENLIVGGESVAFSLANISAYPNPVADKVTVDFGANLEETVQISLLDQTGRTVYSKEAVLYGESKLELDLSNIPVKSGLLFLQVKSGDADAKTIKLLKQ